MKTTIRNIGLKEFTDLDIKCASCNFWFDNQAQGGFSAKNIIDYLRCKLYQWSSFRKEKGSVDSFFRYGGKVKALFIEDECGGIIIYGKPYLFPKIKSFNVYPPDNDSIFIGCIFVKPDYQNMAIGQRLLLSLEEDMVKKRVRALEIIGQRDTSRKEPRSLVPVKYLIQNGFYIKKNDSCWPLMRLDINSLVPDSRLEKILRRNVVINKRVEAPGRLYNG